MIVRLRYACNNQAAEEQLFKLKGELSSKEKEVELLKHKIRQTEEQLEILRK
jgi:hypothetical protein